MLGVFLFTTMPGAGYALEKVDRFVIGEVVKIKSKVLGEDRIVFVNYPRSYNTGWEKYPVLYVLDGARGFPIATSMVRFLSDTGRMPHMIVVGIANTDPIRDLTLTKVGQFPSSGGGAKFTRFLKTELIPEINRNYRTLPFRILSGHSLGGLLGTYIMLEEPGTFNAIITSSPFLQWDNRWFLKQARPLLKKHSSLNAFYYFTIGDEPQLTAAIGSFEKLLQKGVPNGFSWKHEYMKNEDHDSNVLGSLYKGLRWLYFGWKLPQQVMGMGLEGVKNHFQQLSKKYGYKINPPSNTLNDIGFRLMDMKKFKDAISVYQYCTKLYPNFWMAYHNLGYCYQGLGDKSKAIANYEKSLKLNPNNKTAAQRIKELKQ
jgi:predicted alpha/beta superfamily hydrolase